jgi:hypothetical protein
VSQGEFSSKAWSYHRQPDGKDEWLTPPYIIKALGEFDLDPCAPINRPWPTARQHFTELDDGLMKAWAGRVWCNPPYTTAGKWLARCAAHGNAIALTFARTETKMFFKEVFPAAKGIAFIKGRLKFFHVSGDVPKFNAGAGSVLIAYGVGNAEILKSAIESGKIAGVYFDLNKMTISP